MALLYKFFKKVITGGLHVILITGHEFWQSYYTIPKTGTWHKQRVPTFPLFRHYSREKKNCRIVSKKKIYCANRFVCKKDCYEIIKNYAKVYFEQSMGLRLVKKTNDKIIISTVSLHFL